MTRDPSARPVDGADRRPRDGRNHRRGAAKALGAILILGAAAWAGLAVTGAMSGSPRQALAFRVHLPLLARGSDVRPPTPTRGPSPTPITPAATATPTATGTTAVTPTPTPTDTPVVTVTPTATPTELPSGPGIPDCAETRGDLGGFRFSLDDGATMAPNARSLASLAYTWDLDVHPRDPDVIVELHEKTLFRSADAGCTFAPLATFDRAWTDLWWSLADTDLLVLTTYLSDAEPSVAWSEDGGRRWLTEYLPEDALGFAIDPKDPWAWSFVGRAPALYLRTGREARWEARAIQGPGVPGGAFVVNAAAAAPGRPGRWLVGTSGPGLLWTDDQGTTWRAVGAELGGEVGSPPEPVLAVVVSWVTFAPSDADVAYAVVNRVGRQHSERGIWRTGDGGTTWQRRVVDGQPVGDFRAELTGGTRVFVAPDDPDRAYFAFGSFYDDYGTDLFRSRDGLATLTAQHFEGFYKIFAMAWGPPGTDVLFAGTSRDTPR